MLNQPATNVCHAQGKRKGNDEVAARMRHYEATLTSSQRQAAHELARSVVSAVADVKAGLPMADARDLFRILEETDAVL